MSDPLERSRRRFERSLASLQDSIESEIGWAPRAAPWAGMLVAAAAGLALALGLRRKLPEWRSRRRLGDGR